MTEEVIKYYRYDTDGNSEDGFYPYLQGFNVLKFTPKGAWIYSYRAPYKRFVLNGEDGKRYAYPTKDAALKSYIQRKKRHVDILRYKAEYEASCMDKAKEMLAKGEYVHKPQRSVFPWMTEAQNRVDE